jgi:hypothetical protein
MDEAVGGQAMDEALKRGISGIRSWGDLAQFEANARARGRFDAEVQAAVKRRASTLAEALIAEAEKVLEPFEKAMSDLNEAGNMFAGWRNAKGKPAKEGRPSTQAAWRQK